MTIFLEAPQGEMTSRAPYRNISFIILAFDFTCICTMAPSRLHLPPGRGLEDDEAAKDTKYAELERTHIVQPVAAETLGRFGPTTLQFLKELGRRIAAATGDSRSGAFLRQRLSVAIEMANGACVRGTLPRGPLLFT